MENLIHILGVLTAWSFFIASLINIMAVVVMFLWNLSDVIARGKFEYTLFEKKMVIFALIEAAILLAVLAYIIPEQGQTIAFAVMAGLSGVYATIRATALYYYYKK